MPILMQGYSGTVAEVSGTGFRALRVETRPLDVGSLGSYRRSLRSGTMAAGLAADSDVYHWRWTDATRLNIIQKILLDGLAGSATAFTAGLANIQGFISRSWTADGSGGTAGTLTGNNSKLRTSHGSTLLGACRIASTAALTAGTKTNDTDPFCQYVFTIGTTASAQYAQSVTLFGEDAAIEHPLVLAQQEGFTLRATVPATGTWHFGISVVSSEVAAY